VTRFAQAAFIEPGVQEDYLGQQATQTGIRELHQPARHRQRLRRNQHHRVTGRSFRPGQQPIDVGMLARKPPRTGGVLAVQRQPFSRRRWRDGTPMPLHQRVIHRQRAGLARLVLDPG